MTTTVLTADAVVAGAALLEPGWVSITGRFIDAVGSGSPPAAATEHMAGTLVPGFVDVHTHGAAGLDYATAVDGPIENALRWQVDHGTTSLIASLATAPLDALSRQAGALGALVGHGPLRGIHLEGPWLSTGHRGAHAAELLRAPAAPEVEKLLASTDAIRMVTIAPELPGGIEAVRRLVERGIVAAVGHTSGTADDARRAFDAGATVATHLFNGMPPLHHREPGPVSAALLDDRVFVELILDGNHLAPETVELALRLANGRVMTVSDSIAATGFDDGDYRLAGSLVRVRGGVARTADTGSLAGSTRTLDTAFRMLVEQHGLSLVDASAATSATPARALGLDDVGRIEKGMGADLVLLQDLAVRRVMLSGEWTTPANRPDR